MHLKSAIINNQSTIKNTMKPTTTLDSPIDYLKGVGPTKGELLKKELSIFTFRDLLFSFPFRYVDKTKFHKIREINEESEAVQVKGILRRLETAGSGRAKRLVGRLRGETGVIELVWFRGASWIEKKITNWRRICSLRKN